MYATAPTKMGSTDRVIVLEPIDDKLPKTSTGNTDPKLFTGENKLHAVMDEESCHWFLRYESGGLPAPLKQRFTNFRLARKAVEDYFKHRNIKIKEIVF